MATRVDVVRRDIKWVWLILAGLVAVIILFLPQPSNLTEAGHRALAILAFAMIVWVTEAVPFPVSAIVIAAMIALLLGFSNTYVRVTPAEDGAVPTPTVDGDRIIHGPNNVFYEESAKNIGTSAGLTQAMGGLSSNANTLVLAALFLAVAMQVTNLHRRLALVILRAVGERTDAVLIGAILVSTALAFVVPSATARAGAVIPILLGMVAAFGLSWESRLGALMVITAVHSVSIWNIGIKTAAAQNLVGVGFIEHTFDTTIAWGRWFLIAAPWSVIMCVVLFFVMRLVLPPEIDHIEGGRHVVDEQLRELGPMSGAQLRLIMYSLGLLFFWATENQLHSIDSSTITLVAIALMFLPKIGVFTWSEAEPLVSWGTILVFGIGISLGTVLLNTGGAAWLSDATFGRLNLGSQPILVTIALVSLFNIIVHLGFASATSLASALMPVFIALTFSLGISHDHSIGFALIQQFVISIGFLLPISSPQGMLAYGTGTFTIKDYFKAGVPLTIIGYLLILLFSATYWQWIGVI